MQMLQHAQPQSLSPSRCCNGDLPYEQHFGPMGRLIRRRKAYQLLALVGDHAGIGHVTAQQQITIKGIDIEHSRIDHQAVDRGSIGHLRGAQSDCR